MAQNTTPIASCISTAGRSTFLGGQAATGYSISSAGRLRLRFLSSPTRRPTRVACAFGEMLTPARAHLFEQAFVDTLNGSIETQRRSTRRSTGARRCDGVPANGLGNQLPTVARLIAARDALGVRRQAFFVTLGGFDTHGAISRATRTTCWAR